MARTKRTFQERVEWAPHPHVGTYRLHIWKHAPTERRRERYASLCGSVVQTTPTAGDPSLPKMVCCLDCKKVDAAAHASAPEPVVETPQLQLDFS